MPHSSKRYPSPTSKVRVSRATKMKLEDMELFVVLIRQGSFTKAAEFTDIPKSTISRRISALEKRLGVQLITRTTRKLALTDVGRSFLDGCEKLLDQAKTLEHNTRKQSSEPTGLLTLFLPNILFSFIRPVIDEMLETYPELKFDILNSEGIQDEHVFRRFDLMLHVHEAKDSAMIARRITQMRYDYYASPGYIRDKGYLEQPSDIESHQVIFNTVEQTPNLFWKFEYQGELVIQPIDPIIRLQSPELSVELCLEGKGIALVPYVLASDLLQQGKLVRAYRPKQNLTTNLYAIYHSRRFLPAKVTVFMDKLSKFLACNEH